MQIHGDWYDGKSSKRIKAVLQADGDWLQLMDETGEIITKTLKADVRASVRLSNTPRYLYFPDNGKFETADNDAVDTLWVASKTWVHRLEQYWHFVLLALILLAGFVWAFVQYGIPATAKMIAGALPQQVVEYATRESLLIMDEYYFSESDLPEETRQRLHQHFSVLTDAYPQWSLKIIFRKGDVIGANALALPDGTIIFTDELVMLAQHDDELLAILLHEIGHVDQRHGLRSVVQGAVIAFAASLLLGDVSAMTELLASIPVVVTTLRYSREFEQEADDYAYAMMQKHQIPLHRFADIMQRLQDDVRCERLMRSNMACRAPQAETEQVQQEKPPLTAEERAARCRELLAENPLNDGEKNWWSGYLLTHPSTAERVRLFRDAEQINP